MSGVMCYAALLFGNTHVVQIQWVHQFGTYCRRQEIRSIISSMMECNINMCDVLLFCL